MFDLAIPWGTATPVIAEDRVSVTPVISSTHTGKRNNIGPIRVNNPTGRRGKLICTACRKRKWACEYTSFDEPCRFCQERHLTCEKVLSATRSARIPGSTTIHTEMTDGAMVEANTNEIVTDLVPINAAERHLRIPSHGGPLNPIDLDPSALTYPLVPDWVNATPFRRTSESVEPVVTADILTVPAIHTTASAGVFDFRELPPVAVPESLTPREVHYLTYMHSSILEAPESIAGTVFRSLWHVYDVTLSNPDLNSDVLRSSVLASTVVSIASRTRQDVPVKEYAYYKGYFYTDLLRAMKGKTFDETHLFGLYFIIGNARWESDKEFETHLYGFCQIMEELILQSRKTGKQFRLQHIWRLMLSYFRRSYAVYPSHSAITGATEKKDAQLLAMHNLDLQLKSKLNLGGSVNSCDGSSYYSGEPRCRRLSPGWDVMDVLSSLKAKFRTLYHRGDPEPPSPETNSDFGKFLEAIREGIDGFERFRYLHNTFEQMNEPRFEDTSRIEELFIASYIHLHAVLSLMEFIIQSKIAHLPEKVLLILSSKAPASKPEDDVTFLVPTLFCLTLAGEVSGYPKPALEELSSLTCDECVAFAGLRHHINPRRCPHQFSLALLREYFDSYGREHLEREEYISLVLENDWIWGLGIGVCHAAKSRDCDVLGLHLARPKLERDDEGKSD